MLENLAAATSDTRSGSAGEEWSLAELFSFFALACHWTPEQVISLPFEQVQLLGAGISNLISAFLSGSAKPKRFTPTLARQLFGKAYKEIS